jgi:hypothetical protein
MKAEMKSLEQTCFSRSVVTEEYNDGLTISCY